MFLSPQRSLVRQFDGVGPPRFRRHGKLKRSERPEVTIALLEAGRQPHGKESKQSFLDQPGACERKGVALQPTLAQASSHSTTRLCNSKSGAQHVIVPDDILHNYAQLECHREGKGWKP